MARFIDPAFNYRADIPVDDGVLLYLYNKTTLQVLKELDYTDLDYDLAYQYSHYFDTVWKDSPIQIEKFQRNHPHVLYSYVLQKCLRALDKVVGYIVTNVNYNLERADANTEHPITNIPLTNAIVDQLDVVLESGKILKHTNKRMGKYINETYYGNLKQISSTIETLDKMFLYNFIGAGNDKLVTSGDDAYLRRDQIVQFSNLMIDLYSDIVKDAYIISHRDLYFDTVRLMTYMANIMLHTFKPNNMVSEMSNDLYVRYVEESRNDINLNNVYQHIREYTGKSLAYVIEMPFHVNQTGYNREHPERRNEIQPHSLQEQYLVLYFYLDTVYNHTSTGLISSMTSSRKGSIGSKGKNNINDPFTSSTGYAVV